MEKVYIYIRVSDPSSAKNGDGLVRQEASCREYAIAHDMKIRGVFREEGVSGALQKRPALAALMVSLEKNGNGVKSVIIERLDRLARDLMIQEAIVRDFHKSGFNIISTQEGPDLCSDDPTRKLIRQIFGAIAEYDKVMITLKMQAARARIKLRDGKCEGRKRYDESEHGRAVLARLKAMRKKPRNQKRMTWQEIADQLNAEGVKTLDGKTWSLQRAQQTYKLIK
jgi:DNA invertase Pin-like site-specific DNA recombinase